MKVALLVVGAAIAGAVVWTAMRPAAAQSWADKLCAQAAQAGYNVPGCSKLAELAVEGLEEAGRILGERDVQTGIGKALTGAGFISGGSGFSNENLAEVCKRSQMAAGFYGARCPKEGA